MVHIFKITKILFVIAGFICLFLGILGIALPVLPTTPFLLLAAYCFAKGSRKFEVWFKGTKLYKKYVESFVRHRSMTLKQKIFLNVFADSMIAVPLIILEQIWIKLILILIVIYKYYYFIAKIKTVSKEQLNKHA